MLIKIEQKQKIIGTVTVTFDRMLGRLSYPLHNRLYRLTRGRVGHRSPAGPMLLLTSTGRKSGVARTHALLYLERKGQFYVVASNGGRSSNPNWLYNVREEPHVTVQAGARRFNATAHILDIEERNMVWAMLTKFYPGWAHYETLTTRNLQVVRLDPED
jgi:F420H(2)-dependent quinone reductase